MSALEQVKKNIKDLGDIQKIYQLDLHEINIGKITPEIKSAIEGCKNLEILQLGKCGLTSLENLPECNLTALDLSENQLGDDELSKINKYKDLGQLIFNDNKVSKLQSIKCLSELDNLVELDFSGNPVAQQTNYREFTFQNLKKLQILDRADQDGNEVLEEDEFEDDSGSDEEDEEDEEDQDDYSEEEQSEERPKKRK